MLSLKLKGISQNNNHSHNVAFKLLSEIKFRTKIRSFCVVRQLRDPLCLTPVSFNFIVFIWKKVNFVKEFQITEALSTT